MQRIKRLLTIIITCCILIVFLPSCSGRKVVITTGFEKNELMRINTASCYLPEMMLYLTTVQNRYEEVYGKDIWNQSYNGISIEDKVKDMVLAKVAQIKVMNLMAETYGVVLDESEKQTVSSAAESFYESLSEEERKLIGVTKEDIEYYYTEYALSNKVYDYVIRDINPEISDDEARTITVLQILIKTYSMDGDNNRTEYSDRAKKEAEERANDIYEMAIEGELSFEALAAKYNEGDAVTYSFMRGETAKAFEDVAFSLDKDEISKPVETEYGYHIIKCISDFDVEQTQINKVSILKERRDEAFNSTYDEYLSTITKTLNEKLYGSIIMIHNDAVTTKDFFDVEF